ncbi:UNVERIFIED_CONTAM: hypothetical protein NCL1_49798 [Trichonephila clavipes]
MEACMKSHQSNTVQPLTMKSGMHISLQSGATAYRLLHHSINCQVVNMVAKIMSTWLYRQHFTMFLLNHHYNRLLHKMCNNVLLLLSRDQLRKKRKQEFLREQNPIIIYKPKKFSTPIINNLTVALQVIQ